MSLQVATVAGALRPFDARVIRISASVHHVFRADSAACLGPPTEGWEAERVEWTPLSGIPRPVGKGDIVSGTSMAALLYALTER